jgi:hypothetical protein
VPHPWFVELPFRLLDTMNLAHNNTLVNNNRPASSMKCAALIQTKASRRNIAVTKSPQKVLRKNVTRLIIIFLTLSVIRGTLDEWTPILTSLDPQCGCRTHPPPC